MTLDEPRNPHHAAALERGDMPRQIPEALAAERAGAVLRRFVAAPYLTDVFWNELGGKAIASFAALESIHADLQADPDRITERKTVLRQDRTASLDDYDELVEAAHWHKEQWRYLSEVAESVRARPVTEHDPDVRGAREDDARISREVAADKAIEGAPRLAG